MSGYAYFAQMGMSQYVEVPTGPVAVTPHGVVLVPAPGVVVVAGAKRQHSNPVYNGYGDMTGAQAKQFEKVCRKKEEQKAAQKAQGRWHGALGDLLS